MGSRANRSRTVATAGAVERSNGRRVERFRHFAPASVVRLTIEPASAPTSDAVDRVVTTVLTRLPAWSGKRKILNNIIHLHNFQHLHVAPNEIRIRFEFVIARGEAMANNLREVMGLGGADPDDLAAVVCAAMRLAGLKPVVVFVFEDSKAIAIEVHEGERRVARFPMSPVEMGSGLAYLLARQIERTAAVPRGLADPRGTCPGCGDKALDGKVTCGRVQCGTSSGGSYG